MYELDCYIMLIRSTDFNPFRLAAAYASCSPPSPASGDGFHKVSAPRARDKFTSASKSEKPPPITSERGVIMSAHARGKKFTSACESETALSNC